MRKPISLVLLFISVLIYCNTVPKVEAQSASQLPLPECQIIDGVQVGACPGSDIESVTATISGSFSAGSTVQVTTEPTDICVRLNDSPGGFTPFPCATDIFAPTVSGCFTIDLRRGRNNEFIEVSCGSLFENPNTRPTFNIESPNGGRCGGGGDFSTFLYGGPANVPGGRWSERAPEAQVCNITFDGPRPDALIGPTWVRVRVGASITNDPINRTRSTAGRRSFHFVRLEGDIVPLPPVAAFDSEVSGRMVRFTNNSISSDGAPLSFEWDFGDGNSSTSTDPSHVYETPGRFDVTLRATAQRDVGDTASTDDTDEVTNSVVTENRLAVGFEMETDVVEVGDELVADVKIYNFESEPIENLDLSLDFDSNLFTVLEAEEPPIPSVVARDGIVSTSYVLLAESSGESEIRATANGRLTPSAIIVEDDTVKPISINPQLVLSLETSADEFTRAGDTVNVTLTLTNAEDFTIDGVRVESLQVLPNELLEFVFGPVDPQGNDPRVSPLSLGPGETTTVTFAYIARQRGVVELTAFTGSNNPFTGGRFLQRADATLAIETASFRVNNLRLQPERPVPGEIVTIRGEIENIGSLDILNTDFSLEAITVDIQLSPALFAELDPEVSPRIERLEPGSDNAREFIIPVLVDWDVDDITRYTLNVDFTAIAIVDGEDSEVTFSETLRGDLDRTEYWRNTLDFTFEFFRQSVFDSAEDFLEAEDFLGDSSLLGGLLVGPNEVAFEILVNYGDGLLTAGDLISSAPSQVDRYTDEALIIAQIVKDYWSTTSYKQHIIDTTEALIALDAELANLEDAAFDSAVRGFGMYMSDLIVAFSDGNSREFSRLVARPGIELTAGVGAEQAAATVFRRALASGRARGLISGRQKSVTPLSRELLGAADTLAAETAAIERLVRAERRLFKNLTEGVPLTARHAAAAGVSERELAFMLRSARRVQPDGSQAAYFVRPRPASATRHAAARLNAKPLPVKFKSVNDIDYTYLGYNKADEGLVVLTEPTSAEALTARFTDAINRGEIDLNSSEDLDRMRRIWARLSVKQNDFNLRDEFLEKFNSSKTHTITDSITGATQEITQQGSKIQRFGDDIVTTASIDPNTGRLIFDFNGRAVYSDIDLLSVARVDGANLDAAIHMRLLRESGFGFDGQHHATAQTSDFSDARIARAVAEEFLTAHSRGGEALLIVGPNGITKGYVESFDLIPLNEVQNEVGNLRERFVGMSGYDLYGQIVRNIRYTGLGAGQ